MTSPSGKRLIAIDALRGVAAFAVVLYHYTGKFAAFNEDPTVLGFVPAYGFAGVFLFFVISGFCIHMRWTKGGEVRFKEFWFRRWKRLYPAYIVTLLLFLPASTGVYDIVMHLLMLHNLDSMTVYSMNGVLWTLAIEEQLYLLYFVLLWMRKRWDWGTTILICLLARFVWFGVSAFVYELTAFDLPAHEGALANWWIWALGAVSVEAYYGKITLPNWHYSLLLSAGAFAIAATMHFGTYRWGWGIFFEPLFWGAGSYFLLNRVMKAQWNSRIVGIAAFIGLFSYSLYLTHEFVFQYVYYLGISACLLFAYLFYLVLEKPFISKPVRSVELNNKATAS